MLFAIRTDDGGLALGRLRAGRPEVVQPLPVEEAVAWTWATSQNHLGVLDMKGKRLVVFDREGETLVRRPDPPTLSKRSIGLCLVVDEQTVYIGGGTRKGPESMWQYDGSNLVPVPLPAGVGAAGKGLDHLFIDGDRLVAVDDIVLPKFILTFRLQFEKLPQGVSATRLEQHNSYERVSGGATGRSVFALYSQGINRGTSTAHLSILSKNTLLEVASYSVVTSCPRLRPFEVRLPEWFRRPWDQAEPPPQHGLEDGPLNRRPSMAFVGDVLVLGTDMGVFAADLGGLTQGGGRPHFERVEAAGDGKVVDVQGVVPAGCVVAHDAGLQLLTEEQLRDTEPGREPSDV